MSTTWSRTPSLIVICLASASLLSGARRSGRLP